MAHIDPEVIGKAVTAIIPLAALMWPHLPQHELRHRVAWAVLQEMRGDPSPSEQTLDRLRRTPPG